VRVPGRLGRIGFAGLVRFGWTAVVLGVLAVVCLSLAPAAGAARGRYRWPGVRRVSAGHLLSRRVLLDRVGARGRGARHDVRLQRARAAVVGGSRVAIDQAPWQVEIFAEFEGGNEGLSCGGVILDSTHILTAGHCAYEPSGKALSAGAFVIVAGTASVTVAEIEHNPELQAKLVTGVRVHPDFDYALGAGTPDDVAVLTLSSPLTHEASIVEPIGLASAGVAQPEGAHVELTGFGEQSPGGEPDGSLYGLGLTVGFSGRCGGEADAVFLCASATGGSGCSGDSGSGLTGGSPGVLVGVMDTVEVVSGRPCSVGGDNGFVNVAAPEIRDFIEGSGSPPVAPRGGAGVRLSSRSMNPWVGESLTCSPGGWSGSPTFTYDFLDSADGQVLQSGSASTYQATTADIGHTILCELRAVNAGGTAVERTVALAPVVEAGYGHAGEGAALELAKAEEERRAREAASKPPTVAPLPKGELCEEAGVPCEGGELSLAGTALTVKATGATSVKLACKGNESCAGKLTLAAKSSVKGKTGSATKGKTAKKPLSAMTRIATAKFSIAAGETATIKLTLNAAGRALLLAGRGHLSARLTLVQTEPENVPSQTKTVSLTLAKTRSKAKRS
jgi:Trypsin